MFKINDNYLKLEKNYLFSEIATKTKEYLTCNPDVTLLKMGIGDVTLPLPEAVVSALNKAVFEMSKKETFRGYGPEQGYPFLRRAIKNYYAEKGVNIEEDEIFVSDGAKSDLGNILDISGTDNTVLIPDPVYPVYVDTNVMQGRKIIFIDADSDNGFLPLPDEKHRADIIYICSPNNPTGAAYNRVQLKKWVDFALEEKSLILFDAAYERFIEDKDVPKSVYEIDGARNCAIEFCSFSKTAGFTGVRCGYTVVPKELNYNGVLLKDLWLRRQTTKFNGVSYIVQRGAEAVFSPEGREQVEKNIRYYKENAKIIMKGLDACGVTYTGGKNSPYIWLNCPDGTDSWKFFDIMLKKAHVVGTPGGGFGKNGKTCFRLTAFSDRKSTEIATEKIRELIKKEFL